MGKRKETELLRMPPLKKKTKEVILVSLRRNEGIMDKVEHLLEAFSLLKECQL